MQSRIKGRPKIITNKLMNSYFITSCRAFKGFILIVCPVNHMVLPFRNFWSDPYASKDGKFASIAEKRKKKKKSIAFCTSQTLLLLLQVMKIY